LGNTIVQLRDPFSSGSMVAEENPMATTSAFHKPGDVENRLGYYLGQIAR